MVGTFADLGVRDGLVQALAEAGYDAPTALQAGAVPVLRRGGNVVLHASAGAGLVAAYGLGLLDRLTGTEEPIGEAMAGEGPRALVLVATEDRASRVACALAGWGRPLGLRAAALAPGWAGAGGPEVVVATPGAALEAVQTSRVKLDALRAVVLEDLPSLFALAGPEAVDGLTVSLPREAQRILTSAGPTREVEDYIERHLRRALRFPPRAADAPGRPQVTGAVEYAVTACGEKSDGAARALAGTAADRPIAVYGRTRRRAEAAARDLELRGFRASPDAAGEGLLRLSWDVPFDARALAERHAAGGLVLVEPGHLPHLRAIAAEAGLELRVRSEAEPRMRDEVEGFRQRLRQAVREEDLPAQLLLLEPLLREFSGAELAAAASALLRHRPPAPPAERRVPAAATPARPAPYVRLFLSIGKRDNARPADLVGAITGESGIQGEQVGKIEIRDTFSVVEVASEAADRVIRALNGSTLKNRSLRVDYDRKRVARPTPAPRPRTRREKT